MFESFMGQRVDVLMSYEQKYRVPLVGITSYVSYTLTLVVIKQLDGMQHIPKTVGVS